MNGDMIVHKAMMVGVCALAILASAATGGTDYVTLRVVTYNVEFGVNSPGSSTYEAVADMITIVDDDPNDGATGLMPDIVCFQELTNLTNLTSFRNARLPGYQIWAPPSEGDGFLFQGILVRPDINILQQGSVNTVNPRDPIFVVVEVPGSDEVLKVYSTHLKAGNDSSDQTTRMSQADVLGAAIQNDIASGFVMGVPLEKQHVILGGDLNSNNRADGTVEEIFAATSMTACCAPEDGSADENFMIAFGVDCSAMSPCCVPDVSTGLCNLAGGEFVEVIDVMGCLDIRYESIAESQMPGTFETGTRQPSETRLDYLVCNIDLALRHDTNTDGVLQSDEIGAFGYVYRAEQNVPGFHVPGQFANGNADAVFDGADHRPVVADFLFAVPAPTGGCCIEGVCGVLTETDCLAMMGAYLGDGSDCSGDPCDPVNTCAADFDNDGDVDLGDFGVFGAAFNSMTGDTNYDPAADFDGDGDVDLGDFGVFGGQFGRTDCLG